jgi:D-alanyl-D-alanine carboxypeptidase
MASRHNEHLPIAALGLALIAAFAMIVGAPRSETRLRGSVTPITTALCQEMKLHHVLNPGGPVGCERLRLIKFPYVDFNARNQDDGEIVVMDAAAEHVLDIFTTLLSKHFPIAKAKLMNVYEGNDDASMSDNNTSAFNVRDIVGGNSISLHAYGLAIDINPIQNPYIKRLGSTLMFSPPSGIAYANRLDDRPGKNPRLGMAEAVVDVFADSGFFIWGGYWDDPIDYQHFQVSRGLAEQLARLSFVQAQRLFDKVVQNYRRCRSGADERGQSNRSKCILVTDVGDN